MEIFHFSGFLVYFERNYTFQRYQTTKSTTMEKYRRKQNKTKTNKKKSTQMINQNLITTIPTTKNIINNQESHHGVKNNHLTVASLHAVDSAYSAWRNQNYGQHVANKYL